MDTALAASIIELSYIFLQTISAQIKPIQFQAVCYVQLISVHSMVVINRIEL